MEGTAVSRTDDLASPDSQSPSTGNVATVSAPASYNGSVAGVERVESPQGTKHPTPCPPPRTQSFLFIDANSLIENEARGNVPPPVVQRYRSGEESPAIFIYCEIFDGDLPSGDDGKRTFRDQARESGRFVRMMLGPYMNTDDVLVCMVGPTWPDTDRMKMLFEDAMLRHEGWALDVLRDGFPAPHGNLDRSIQRILL